MRSSELNKKGQAVLPFWPQDKRGIPNSFARSSLFRVSANNQKRQWFEGDLLEAIGNCTIRYTGHELRQDDADLYLQILHLAKDFALGTPVEFKTATILKSLKRAVNSVYRDKMIRSLTRMTATAIEVADENSAYTGSMIQSFSWKDEDGGRLPKLRVTLDPKIIALFGWDNHTQIIWDQRLALSPLGKWLHYTYMSHKSPFPMKVKTLMTACGSQMDQLRDFRKALIVAMNDLVKVGAIESFEINKQDNLVVHRFPVVNKIADVVEADVVNDYEDNSNLKWV